MLAPFGVNDIVAVGTLVWNVYAAYAGGPEQFRNFSREILSLHVIARKVEDQLGILGSGATVRLPGFGGVASLSTNDGNDLKIVYDDLRTVMVELYDLLKRYHQSLASNTCNPIDQSTWGQEDLVGWRDKIRSGITLRNTFNGSLAKYVHHSLTYSDFRYMKIFLHRPTCIHTC